LRVMRIGHLAIAVLALCGVVLAFLAYTAPFGTTGVDGSIGALLALIGAVVTTFGATLLALDKLSGRKRVFLIVFLVFTAGLTAVAGYFLMQFLLAIIMAATALALILPLFSTFRRSAA